VRENSKPSHQSVFKLLMALEKGVRQMESAQDNEIKLKSFDWIEFIVLV